MGLLDIFSLLVLRVIIAVAAAILLTLAWPPGNTCISRWAGMVDYQLSATKGFK